ncbi:MAG: TIGR04222 domain-containing membrane protein, partial [Gammaproteobacteria bacterium]|nr:TIGR04222 domain-containing membrane protein [Gammaproteobacteria bacterium]
MNLSNPYLYSDIESFEIGEKNIVLSFSTRLSRENDWSSSYSERVIKEYKKFIYLCCVSNQQLTPSDQVDQVWHLHLAYTQSYWNEMCRKVLKTDIHHGPTKGGGKETNKYKQQYLFTTNFYEKEFGEEPPKDIWPNVTHRFENADKFIRINESEFWIVKKPSKYIAPIFFASLFLTACSNDGDGS